MKTKPHPFHLVEPSPWPLSLAVAVFLLTVGGVLHWHEHTPWGEGLLAIGTFWICLTMIGWWRDVLIESKIQENHTPEVKCGFQYGMIGFIITEVMFFAACFSAYFYAANLPVHDFLNTWPPKAFSTIDPFGLPYLNTLLLLLSGSVVTWAHQDLCEGNIQGMIAKTGYTILLGIAFLGVQICEYAHLSFTVKSDIYCSNFFFATGFHGLHVLIGVAFLSVCWWRAKKGDFTSVDHFGFEAAAWYWHFVDVVWLFLFIFVYLWGTS